MGSRYLGKASENQPADEDNPMSRCRCLHHASTLILVLLFSAPLLGAESDGPRRRLFLDDQDVAHIDKLRFTMHSPVKKGAVIWPEKPWEQFLETRSAPVWDAADKRWKLWVFSAGDPGAFMTYFESEDGLKWNRPTLEQFAFRGSRDNNILLLDGKGWPFSAIMNVVLDENEPRVERRYKGLAHTHGRDLVVSPDGKHWQRLAAPRLVSRDESNLIFDAVTKTYLASMKREGGPFGRAVTLSASQDFEHWTEPELIFHADDEDRSQALSVVEARLADSTLQKPTHSDKGFAKADIYSMPIFRYEDMYVGLPAYFYQTAANPDDGFHHVQLASSRDMRKWKRLGDRKPFIGPSSPGTDIYDTMQILPPSRPILRDNELWFYYTGLRYRYQPSGVRGLGAVCLATLRRDGFVSLDAGNDEGTLLTMPLTLPAGDLHLNVDAAHGHIAVHVCNANGDALPGLDASPAIEGDHTDVKVAWPKGSLDSLRGKEVALRFKLVRAQLYSYWFQ